MNREVSNAKDRAISLCSMRYSPYIPHPSSLIVKISREEHRTHVA